MSIASKNHGEVIVLHAAYIPVLYDPVYAGGTPLAYDPSFLAHVEDDTKKGFEKMKKEFALPNIPLTLEIIHDNVVSAVNKVVEIKEADLIVMGTSGTSGWKETWIGSNTEKVVRHASVPVLTVHTAPDVGSIKRILLPTTLRLDQDDFIDQVKQLQQFFGAELYILLINTPSNFMRDEEAKDAMEEFAKYYQLDNYVLYFRNYHHEDEGIVDFANKNNIDMLVMLTHARKGLAHLVSGSITEGVVNKIYSPVWTFSMQKKKNISKESMFEPITHFEF